MVWVDWLAARVRKSSYQADHSAAAATTGHRVWIAVAREDGQGDADRPVVASLDPQVGDGDEALVDVGQRAFEAPYLDDTLDRLIDVLAAGRRRRRRRCLLILLVLAVVLAVVVAVVVEDLGHQRDLALLARTEGELARVQQHGAHRRRLA